MYKYNNDILYPFQNINLNEGFTSPDYWYHLVPKGANMSHGIMSPVYMLDKNLNSMADHAVRKYADRMVGGWNIYPGRDPNTLSTQEIITGLNKFRGSDGAKQIYLFRYPPVPSLGKNMKRTLSGKDIYQVDLNKIPDIQSIDYGHHMSHGDNKPLSRRSYEITPKEYFSHYDDNGELLFASINHISIVTSSGHISNSAIKKISISEAERIIK